MQGQRMARCQKAIFKSGRCGGRIFRQLGSRFGSRSSDRESGESHEDEGAENCGLHFEWSCFLNGGLVVLMVDISGGGEDSI